MRAITLHNPGAESRLVLTEVPTPLPERNEVRVRIRAAGVNRADLLQRRGLHPAPSDAPSNILALEFAGEVDEIGKNVVQFKQGDRVFGLVGGGAYAEQICTHERMVTKLPDCLSFEEGGPSLRLLSPHTMPSYHKHLLLQARHFLCMRSGAVWGLPRCRSARRLERL